MTGSPLSPIEHSDKHNIKKGRKTKPHPPINLISFDSLRHVESDTDLQFLKSYLLLYQDLFQNKIYLPSGGSRGGA